MIRRTRATITALVVALAAVGALSTAATTPALAAGGGPEDAGAVRLVDAEGVSVTRGGSRTEFAFDLEGPDECQGDSQNGNFRTNSFMVPVDVQVPDIEFNGLGPQPMSFGDHATFRMPMYDTQTADFTSGLTAQADELGGPGAIVDLRPLWFGIYGEGELPPGEYRIGLVCTHVEETTRFWDTTIEVFADEADPAGIRWVLTGSNEGVPSSAPASWPDVPPWVLILLAGAVVAGALEFRARRRASGDADRPSVEVG